ncbi:MAG: TauD/TfdA family dioxygenase [Rhodospirillales bacterium]
MTSIHKQPVTDRSAWVAADFRDDDSWIETWSAAELDEIDAALRAVRQSGRPWHEITRETFEAPAAGARLEAVAEELENGRGFALLRGLPIENYSLEEARTIYWGLGTYLGDGVSQNFKGHVIASVRDMGKDYNDANARGYVSRHRLSPHCDPTDAVGLLCYRKPLSGGISSIASSMAIYNRILAEHPEYLEALYEGYYYFLRGEGASGKSDEITYNRIPVYSYFDNRLSCRYNGNMIRTAQTISGEKIPPNVLEVLDYFEDLAMSPEFRLDMTLEFGDMQFLCNHSTVHTRSEFVDGEDEAHKRHLLRLWLYLHRGRKLAPEFADRYNTGPRGGCAITVPPDARQYAA